MFGENWFVSLEAGCGVSSSFTQGRDVEIYFGYGRRDVSQ